MSRIAELLDVLQYKGMLRPTSADPRLPPRLNLPPPEEGEQGAQIAEIDIGRLERMPPRRPPDREAAPDQEDRPDHIQGWDVDPEVIGQVGAILDNGPEGLAPDWPGGSATQAPVVDSYAWYCPFHFYEHEYGIYIKSEGLDAVSGQLLRLIPRSHRRALLPYARTVAFLVRRAAFFYFYLHEFYHHKVESFATRLEIIENQPRYVPYHSSVYEPARTPVLTDNLVEEGLAVAEVLRRLKSDAPYKNPGFLGALNRNLNLRDLVHDLAHSEIIGPRLPPGYARANNILGPKHRLNKDRFLSEQRLLSSMIQEACLKPLRSPDEWLHAPDVFSSLYDINCVAYEIIPPGRSATLPSKAAPAAQASASKALRAAARWGVRKSKNQGGRTRGDHVWLENGLGDRDHIDSGATDMSSRDWDAVMGLINKSHGLNLKNNIEGRRTFFAGPR